LLSLSGKLGPAFGSICNGNSAVVIFAGVGLSGGGAIIDAYFISLKMAGGDSRG
jgi:hypothetical protein